MLEAPYLRFSPTLCPMPQVNGIDGEKRFCNVDLARALAKLSFCLTG